MKCTRSTRRFDLARFLRQAVDAAVMDKLTRDVLCPAVVRAIIAAVFEALEPEAVTTNVGALSRELRALDEKIAHLTAAIEGGAALAPVVAKLQSRQSEREQSVKAIAAAEAVASVRVDRQNVEKRVPAEVANSRELMTSNGRQALREILSGPIRFNPNGKQYAFEGSAITGSLISGLIGDSTFCGVPNGIREKVESRFSGIAA
jgi:hypothetical protein